MIIPVVIVLLLALGVAALAWCAPCGWEDDDWYDEVDG